jgi:hypothetical protein
MPRSLALTMTIAITVAMAICSGARRGPPRSSSACPQSASWRWRRPANGLLAPELAAGIQRVKSAKSIGVRAGNWLSPKQAQALLNAPDITTLKGLRDRPSSPCSWAALCGGRKPWRLRWGTYSSGMAGGASWTSTGSTGAAGQHEERLMRVLERRLRRLEVGLLPLAETAEWRRIYEIVPDIRRRRAARLGLSVPEDVPEPRLVRNVPGRDRVGSPRLTEATRSLGRPSGAPPASTEIPASARSLTVARLELVPSTKGAYQNETERVEQI